MDSNKSSLRDILRRIAAWLILMLILSQGYISAYNMGTGFVRNGYFLICFILTIAVTWFAFFMKKPNKEDQ